MRSMPKLTQTKSELDPAELFLRCIMLGEQMRVGGRYAPPNLELADKLFHQAISVEDPALWVLVLETIRPHRRADIEPLLTDAFSIYTVAIAKRPISNGQPASPVQKRRPRKQRAAPAQESANTV